MARTQAALRNELANFLSTHLARGRFPHEEVFGRLQRTVFQSEHRFAAYLVDDTGFEKKGNHSAGVQRQYRERSGKWAIAR